jgi:hypothetical protein
VHLGNIQKSFHKLKESRKGAQISHIGGSPWPKLATSRETFHASAPFPQTLVTGFEGQSSLIKLSLIPLLPKYVENTAVLNTSHSYWVIIFYD